MHDNQINICSDPILKEYLAKQGIQAHVFDSVLSTTEKTQMLEELEQFASNWFLTKDAMDYTDYRNVSIGAALHDESKTFFLLLFHFIFIINKIGGLDTNIVFYQSTSCLMPDIVIDFLTTCNIKVELIDEKYPWLSFKDQHDSQIRCNFSRVSFSHGYHQQLVIKDRLREIKLLVRQQISKIFYKIFGKRKRIIYLHAFRSLMPFFIERLNDINSSFNVYVTDTTPLQQKSDTSKLGFLQDVWQLLRLAQKGIVLDSLKCPFYFKWYLNYKKKNAYTKLFSDFQTHSAIVKKSLTFHTNEIAVKFFFTQLHMFYLNQLVRFMKLIDYYYEKINALEIESCLQEMCHPFQAQVLANLKIPCHLFPSNFIIHNQYFAPLFFEKVKHQLNPLVFSNLDAERFIRLGFAKEDIRPLPTTISNYFLKKLLPLHYVDSLKGKKILILAPSIIAMDTYRYQVQSERLYEFFSEVFEILSEAQVSSVIIRPHPGANVSRNQHGYTDNDILRYLINNVPDRKKLFEVRFSTSYFHNLEQDIVESDLVIANMSGSLFWVLAMGRDYIFFDDTVTPYYGTKDWTIFNEGTIVRLQTKEQLKNHLANYKSPNIESLRKRLFEDTFLLHNKSNG